MEEGWTPGWRRWFAQEDHRQEASEARTLWIRDRVRAAVRELDDPERMVVEAIYYDGLSLDQIGARIHLTKNRVAVAHRRALASLRITLTPLVAEFYGLRAVAEPSCPICTAVWRDDAESMLDAKTAEMTWGELIVRMNRAFGWRAKSPRVLIVHQQRHRVFGPIDDREEMEVDESDGEITGTAFDQAVCLDRNENALGRPGHET
jgi:hypothetical protein